MILSPDYLRTLGVMTDEEINAICGGRANMTVSLSAAIAQRQGKPWGCWLCWFLNWAVQRAHCALQFTAQQTPPMACVRAAVCFALAACAIGALMWLAVLGCAMAANLVWGLLL